LQRFRFSFPSRIAGGCLLTKQIRQFTLSYLQNSPYFILMDTNHYGSPKKTKCIGRKRSNLRKKRSDRIYATARIQHNVAKCV
jgi:hypothetical protein